MVKYVCETCLTEFSQRGHLKDHKNRKRPCKKNNTIEALVDQKIQKALAKTDVSARTHEPNSSQLMQSSNVDYSTKTREQLISLCKERSIKGYSNKKKEDIITLLSNIPSVPRIKRVASLFAGCGGLDYGFLRNPKYTHVFVNDFDEDACKSYENNFHIKPVCGDIKKIETIPDCDLLIGGFPCQGFSMANPYRNERDERNELYLEILRLLRLKQPSYFLLENVKGLLNMGGYETKEDKKNQTGKIMKVIMRELQDCGYKVMFKLFDIKQYGVPQKRQRVIIIGVKNTIDFQPKWPEPTNQVLTLRDAIGNLPIEYDPSIQHIGTKHKCAVTGYLGNRELNWDEPAPTITGRGGGSGGPVIHNHPSLRRRLTVRECARIQTFPDTFEFSGTISSMYKQLGNAVPCKFSEHLSTIFENAP